MPPTTEPTPDRPGRSSSRIIAYRTIRDAIITGEYPPGVLLSENELAAALGISRQPVREALLLIAQERLVEVRPHSGTYVALIDPREVAQAQFIREAIELSSLRRCGPLSAVQRAELTEIVERQRAVVDRADFYPLDEEFHRYLLGVADHAGAWATVSSAKGHLDRARYLGLSGFRDIQEYVDDHARIAAAVAAGDLDAAASELQAHLRFVLTDIEAIRDRYPAYFEPLGPGRMRERPSAHR
jgi:GntR family transcriptional regulator, rspAB operon transcriptional repressor